MANFNFDDMNRGQKMPVVAAVIMDPATNQPVASALPRSAALLAAAAATGSAVVWRGGPGVIDVWGTFGGATATFQSSPDAGVTWVAVGSAGIFNAAGTARFDLPAGRPIRVAISGGSGVSISSKAEAI